MTGTSLIHSTFGWPSNPPSISEMVGQGLEMAGPSASVRLGFAYACLSGAQGVLHTLDGIPAWESAQKEWIFSVHQAITEPAVVKRVQGIPNSKVRLFCGKGKFEKAAIFRPPFHAKLIAVNRAEGALVLLWSGSANFTGAALSAKARNFEAGLAVIDPDGGLLGSGTAERLDQWWTNARKLSISPTEPQMRDYARWRDDLLVRNPSAFSEIEPPLDEIAKSSSLWIEAGKMSGGVRNGVEFGYSLAWFFGRPTKRQKILTIWANKKKFDDRPLSTPPRNCLSSLSPMPPA